MKLRITPRRRKTKTIQGVIKFLAACPDCGKHFYILITLDGKNNGTLSNFCDGCQKAVEFKFKLEM